jgi:predicted RNA binding protein YcfA (HicA-like mRNA interferase family)
MGKLPRLTAREIISVLEKLGFSLVRQSVSHMIYKNAQGKRATVPFHTNKTLHPKVLKSILRDAELTAEGLERLLCSFAAFRQSCAPSPSPLKSICLIKANNFA